MRGRDDLAALHLLPNRAASLAGAGAPAHMRAMSATFENFRGESNADRDRSATGAGGKLRRYTGPVTPIHFRALPIAALGLSFAAPAIADSWARPQVREVFSASRDHFVRVTPGSAIGDTVGFAGAAKGKYATAEFYRRQPDRSYRLMHTVTLLNPVAPVDYFVSDEGRMVTVDNWHNRGYGSVLAVYDPSGRLVKAYTLNDLFLKSEIDAYPHSVSSRHWHNGPVYLNKDQRTLYMMIASGRDLVLGLETGAYAYCEPRAGKYLCRNSNTDRQWRPHDAAVPRK